MRHCPNDLPSGLRFAIAPVIAALAISLGAGFATTGPAQAGGIKCINGFQIVKGARLATPYCQDNLLAQVAREYGSRVSAKTIRNNPNEKRNVCRLIGQDIRVKHNCDTILPTPSIGGGM